MSDENTPQTVPLERFNKVIEARKEAEARARAAEARLAEVEPQIAGLESLSEQLAAEKTARADDAARFAAREAFLGAGITDSDEMEILRARHAGIPKKDRPELADWLGKGAKEDKIASRFLRSEPAPADDAEAPAKNDAPAATPPAARTNTNAAPTPPAAREMTRAVYYQRLAEANTAEEKRAVVAEYGRQ